MLAPTPIGLCGRARLFAQDLNSDVAERFYLLSYSEVVHVCGAYGVCCTDSYSLSTINVSSDLAAGPDLKNQTSRSLKFGFLVYSHEWEQSHDSMEPDFRK